MRYVVVYISTELSSVIVQIVLEIVYMDKIEFVDSGLILNSFPVYHFTPSL